MRCENIIFIVATEEESLLAAARQVLDERGYEGLRVEDVLQRAGLSTRAFYRHFAGKAELFLALFEQESIRAGRRLEARVGAADAPADAVRAWVAGVLTLAYDARLAQRARLFAGERGVLARQFPDEIDRSTRRQVEPLEAAIAAGRDAGVFPGADPPEDARAIHHLTEGFVADRLMGTTSLRFQDAVARAAGFALQALEADGSARRAN